MIGLGIFCTICFFQLAGICTSLFQYKLKRNKICPGFCTPETDNAFYKLKYEKYLEIETHNHLKEKMKDIAKQKAQLICEEPLRKIRVMELNQYSMEAATTAAFEAARATVTAALKVVAVATEPAGPAQIAVQEQGKEQEQGEEPPPEKEKEPTGPVEVAAAQAPGQEQGEEPAPERGEEPAPDKGKEPAGPLEVATAQRAAQIAGPELAATAKAWEAAAAERGKGVAFAAAEVAEAAVTVAVAAAETLQLGKKDQTHVDAAKKKAKYAAEQVTEAKKLMTSVTVAAIMAASAAAKVPAPPTSAPAKAAEAAQKLAVAAQAAVSAAEQAAARAAAMANATAAMAGVPLQPNSSSSEEEKFELLKRENVVLRVEYVTEAEKTKLDPWIYVSKPNCHLMMK